MSELGFTKCVSKHGLHKRTTPLHVVVRVYADDPIFNGARSTDADAFKKQMHRLFQMRDLGPLSFYFKLNVKQGCDSTLGQATYARKLLEKASMGTCNTCHTPMEVRLKLSKKSSTPKVDATMNRCLVGSLRYLVHTMSDIKFAVGFGSLFMETATRASSRCQAHPTLHRRCSQLRPCLQQALQHQQQANGLHAN